MKTKKGRRGRVAERAAYDARALTEGLEQWSIDNVRDVLGRLVVGALFGGKQYILTRYGEPAVAIVGMRDFAKIRQYDEEHGTGRGARAAGD